MADQKKKKLGRRKRVSFYVKECREKADRGFNMAVQVYELDNKTLELKIRGGDYRINTACWKGDFGAGIAILSSIYSDLKHDGYRIKDDRVVNYQSI